MKKPSWKSEQWLCSAVAIGKYTEEEAQRLFDQLWESQQAGHKALRALMQRQAKQPVEIEHTPEQLAALEESFREHGPATAVLEDSYGVVIDGNARKAICKKLRMKCPTLTVPIRSEEQRRRVKNRVQHLGKKRTRKRLEEDIERELRRDSGQKIGRTDRVIAADLGTTHPTVGKVRRKLIRSGKFTNPKILVGEKNKVYTPNPTVVLSDGGAGAKRAQRALQALGDKAPDGLVPVRTLERLAHQEQRREAMLAAAERGALLPEEERYKLHHCRMQDLLTKGYIQPRSVSLMLTDPLWGRQYLQDWVDLADLADELLMDNGLLVAYCGDDLPDYLDRLRRRLNWVCMGAVVWNGAMPRPAHPGNLFMGFRPVAIFCKGKLGKHFTTQPDRKRLLANCAHVRTPDHKDRHPYQQELAGLIHWVRHLSFPGEVVCDPFLGSGSGAVATKLVGEGRYFIGCDQVREHVLGAREWLGQVVEGSAPKVGGV